MRLVIPWFGDKSCLDKYVRGEKVTNFFETAYLRFSIEKESIWFNCWFNEYADEDDDKVPYGYRDVNSTGFKIFKFAFDIIYARRPSWYTCNCGWQYPEDPYVIDDKTKKFLKMAEFSHIDENRKLHYKPVENATIYPICADERYISTPDVRGYDWEEKHYCPICNNEFEFSNSSY